MLQKTYGDGYTYALSDLGGADCTYSPVVYIASANPTPEQIHKEQMSVHLRRDLDYARLGNVYDGGLEGCGPDRHEGILENIFVCFNRGNASKRFDVPAYLDLEAKRVRVPVRFVSEMMRADVSWDEPTQTVTIHFPKISREIAWPVPKPGYTPADLAYPETFDFLPERYQLTFQTITQPERSIKLTVGKPVALVDGKEVPIDAPPVLLPPGRVMVPVRFVSEVMGAKVYWVGKDPIWKEFDRPGSTRLVGRYQVHIFTPFYPFFDYPDWFLETRAQRT